MTYIKFVKRYTSTKKVAIPTKWNYLTYKDVTVTTYKTLNLRVKNIDWNPQIKSVIKPYVGSGGSSTLRSGTGGRLLNIQAIARDNDVASIQALVKDDQYLTLSSSSKAEYTGQYYLVDLQITEKKKGIYDVSMKLQERAVFNTRYMNFKTYNVAVRAANYSPLKLGQKWNPG